MVVTGSLSSSGSGASTICSVNGYSCPCRAHGQAGGATGAGFQAFAKVIDAQHEAIQLLCYGFKHIHDCLSGGWIILVAGASITCSACRFFSAPENGKAGTEPFIGRRHRRVYYFAKEIVAFVNLGAIGLPERHRADYNLFGKCFTHGMVRATGWYGKGNGIGAIGTTTPDTTSGAQQLRHQPLCERCLAEGEVEPATIAHHIERHRGDINAFRSGALWSLCDGLTESGKPRQKRVIGPDGFPIG